jgi:hypothetical protein
VTNTAKTTVRIGAGLILVAIGVYLARADAPPGVAVDGMLLMIVAVVLGVRAARNGMPAWAARTTLGAGVVLSALAAFLFHAAVVTGPLFAQPREVPSVTDSAPPPQYAGAVDRARELVRSAILGQNLPGVSVAVGTGGAVVWAEGFGWRDVHTRTPVTPKTRFNIGTAAPIIDPASVASLKLANTGAESAAKWSPEHIGEPEEDFPPFTVTRHLILQPLGVAPPEYPLPEDRATFYVPRSDDNPSRGRRLMYMRDLACCAGKMASYSTASDLVRVALAREGGINTNGELAGGTVMSLVTRDGGVVVAVLSNVAHANTSALAAKIGDAFTNQSR